MSKSANGRALFERLRTGLEEGIQFARDELSLRTTEDGGLQGQQMQINQY